MSWFTDYWPWWVGLCWLGGYEVFVLLTHRPTLSRLVWRAARTRPWLAWIVTLAVVVLLLHFFVGTH